jgi:hypothetical protein
MNLSSLIDLSPSALDDVVAINVDRFVIVS